MTSPAIHTVRISSHVSAQGPLADGASECSLYDCPARDAVDCMSGAACPRTAARKICPGNRVTIDAGGAVVTGQLVGRVA